MGHIVVAPLTSCRLRVVLGLLLAALAACAGPAAAPPAPASSATSATAAAGSAASTASPTAPPELRKVTVGYVANQSLSPIYVAYEKGYYREQGLDVSLQTLTGGSDMVTQTASGNFDVGVGGPGAGLFNALARGIYLTLVAPVTIFKPPTGAMLVGSKLLQESGEVQTIADLRGRRVSIIAKGAANDYILDLALRRGGLTIRDVDLQVVPAPETVPALANGAIAAGMISEPFASEAIARGAGVVLNNDYANNVLIVAMYFNENFAQARREDGIRLLTGYYQAVRDLQPPYQDEDVAIIAQYTRLAPETIRAAARPYHDLSGDLHLADLEAMQQFVMAQGEASYPEPLDFAQYVDPSFGADALARLGLPSPQGGR